MVCHYTPKEHLLEVRAEFDCRLWDRLCSDAAEDTFLIGLTSIHWREAWKYGQRAYRYCQHDAGHAIGAICVAAAGLGWQAAILDDVGTDELAHLMGTFRDHDAEQEEPDVLMAVGPRVADVSQMHVPKEPILAFSSLDWKGNANHLSPSHVDWGMNDIAAQTRKPQCLHGHALPRPRPRPQAAPLTSSNLRDSRPGVSSADHSAAPQRRGHGPSDAHHAGHVLSDAPQDRGRSRNRALQHAAVDSSPPLGNFCSPCE